eukprot:TRINITY_DN3547_c0_g1_i2.p1 TRINITY_DN3547_c0_g1~~TRINITY_DN3547_c0_g1_i2.p1  ORF type:complete len:397 (+),score=46.88 TRINITY_DN3547_c0_g1_i2:526-1716(+)
MMEKYSCCSCNNSHSSLSYLPLIEPEITAQDFKYSQFVLKGLKGSTAGSVNMDVKGSGDLKRELKALLNAKSSLTQGTSIRKDNFPLLFQSYYMLRETKPKLAFLIDINTAATGFNKKKNFTISNKPEHESPEKKLFSTIPKAAETKVIGAIDYSITEHDIFSPRFDSFSLFEGLSRTKSSKKVKLTGSPPVSNRYTINRPEGKKQSKSKVNIKNSVLRGYLTSAIRKHLEVSKKYHSRNSTQSINSREHTAKNLPTVLQRAKHASATFIVQTPISKSRPESTQMLTAARRGNSRGRKVSREVRKERGSSLVNYWVARDRNRTVIPVEMFVRSALERHKARIENKIASTTKYIGNSRNAKNFLRSFDTFRKVKSSLAVNDKTLHKNRYCNSIKPFK